MTAESDDPTVPIICTECDTASRVPLEDVADAVSRHNDRLHDGEPIAQVDPAITEQIANLAADDLGLLEDA